MKNFQRLKNGLLLIRIVFIILISFTLTSCIEVKQEININKDGSGDTKLEVAIQKEILFDPQAISNLKNELEKGGWNILEETEIEGRYVITAKRKFKDVSELNDEGTRYMFSSERRGFFKNFYTLEIKHIKTFEIPFPYEISIKMPGSIDETNGEKVSSDEAKWNLQGLLRGTKLYIKSSGFTMPVFVLLLIVIAAFILVFISVVVVRRMFGPSSTTKQDYPRGIFCTHCANENPANASFCTNCGQRLK